LAFLGMAIYAYSMLRRSGFSHPNTLALHWTIGSTVFSAFGAGILGFAHTWPQVNQWTHGTHITTMHGHMAFFGAYAMINLAITYALPGLRAQHEDAKLWVAAFWLMVSGMFGMTMALDRGLTQTISSASSAWISETQEIQVHSAWLASRSCSRSAWSPSSGTSPPRDLRGPLQAKA
jgi:nitric oxide reductase subunit B